MAVTDTAQARDARFGGRPRLAARVALPVLLVATFISLVHYLAFSPLLPLMAPDPGVSVSVLGQVPAGIGLGAGRLGLLVGPLADQYGHRRALLAGLLALVASSSALVIGPALLPVAALLGAAGRATVYPIALAGARTRFEGGRPSAGSVKTPAPAPVANFVDAYRPVLRHPSTLGVIGATFLLSAGGWITWTYLGTFLIERHGFSTQAAGWAWLVVGVGLLGGGLLGRSRLGKGPLRRLFAGAAVGGAICLGAGFGLPSAPWSAVAMIAVGTLLHGLTQVASAAVLSQETPGGHAASMTLRGSAMSLGGALGSGVGGALLPIARFGALALVALACCLGGALMVWPPRVGPVDVGPAKASCECAACLAKAPV